MKYIVMKVAMGDMTLELPFVFPNECVHSLIANAMIPALEEQWEGAVVTPISAGSVSCGGLGKCYGESDTLKLKSRGEIDSMLLRTADYGGIIT